MISILRHLTFCFLLVILVGLLEFSCKGPDPTPEADTPETVYAGHGDGHLYALDAMTGTKKWAYPIETPVYNAPTIANGIVYISGGTKLYAIDAITGTEKWDVTLMGDKPYGVFRSVPIVVNKIVYVSGSDGSTGMDKLVALDALTGTVKWEYLTGGSNINSPTVANGIIYIGSDYRDGTSKIKALEALTGIEKWEIPNLRFGLTNPSVIDGIIYTKSYRNLYAHDALTGVQKWVSNTNLSDGSLTVEGGLIFLKQGFFNDISIDGASLDTFNAETGKFLKHFNFAWIGNTSPFAVNGIIYVGSGGVRIGSSRTFTFYAVDGLTATEKWVQNLEFAASTSPTVAAGTVFVGAIDAEYNSSKMYALDALTGAVKWESNVLLHYYYTSPCVVTKKGVVYHPSESGDQQ